MCLEQVIKEGDIARVRAPLHFCINTLLQQKSMQMNNILAEQQVNNNSKAKPKQESQEQLS